MSAFDKVIGYDEIKEELIIYADIMKNPDKYRRLEVSIPAGILLSGDPGLGKTLMAKCFIEESGCKVYTLRKEKPNGDFINQIKETFDKAKQEDMVIVFLDDMDKFANEDTMHCDAEEYVTIQSCIDDCDGTGVMVLATVNNKYRLPDSLLRAGRFDKVIDVENPKGKDAERIIEHFVKQKKIVGDIDIEEIARFMEGYSCAELETVINEAGIYAAYIGKDSIEHSDIIKASLRMIYGSPEAYSHDKEFDLNIAVHEAGHAVVGEILDPGSVTVVTICRYRSPIGGVTRIKEPRGFNYIKELQEHTVIRNLAGKAATEIVFGKTDMGCNSDMHNVFDTVSEFVDDICALGFEAFEGSNPSQHLLEAKDRLIASEVARYYQEAKRILVENRGFLDAVVDELLEHETITYRDMQRIKTRTQQRNSSPAET